MVPLLTGMSQHAFEVPWYIFSFIKNIQIHLDWVNAIIKLNFCRKYNVKDNKMSLLLGRFDILQHL